MASKLLQFETEEGAVLIAVPTPEGMVQPTGRLEDTIEAMHQSLDGALRVVAAVSKSFRDVFDESDANGAELELGLQFTAKGSVYVVETTGNATLKIKLSYTRKA
jgi:hypothetical protein